MAPRPDTLALRDQILAALRDHGGMLLATGEIPSLLGLRDYSPPRRRSDGTYPDSRCQGCGGWHQPPVKRYPAHQRVYNQLRALMFTGEVGCEMIAGRVYWRATPADEQIAELEAMLEGSADA